MISTCFHDLHGFPLIITHIDYTPYGPLSPSLVCHPMPARNVSYSQSKPRSTDQLSQHPPLHPYSHNTEVAPTTSKLISYGEHYWSVYLYHACSLVARRTFMPFILVLVVETGADVGEVGFVVVSDRGVRVHYLSECYVEGL